MRYILIGLGEGVLLIVGIICLIVATAIVAQRPQSGGDLTLIKQYFELAPLWSIGALCCVALMAALPFIAVRL